MAARELTEEDNQIIEALRKSSENTLEFFDRHRKELRMMVRLRMDPRLCRRLDPSDVIQEAFVNYPDAVEEYLSETKRPPLVWLRFFVRKVLWSLSQKHVQSQCRDVRREIPDVDVDRLADSVSSIGRGFHQAELRGKLKEIFASMAPLDREVLALVHLEGKKVRDAASELDITLEACKKRYLRALRRLAGSWKASALEVFQG